MDRMTSSRPVSPMSVKNGDDSTRFVVVMDPTDEKPYSISFRYVLHTVGLERVTDFLEKNTKRKHKKHIQLPLCDSVVLGTPCMLREQCPNIHVTHEGYARRRLWFRPLTIQRLMAAQETRRAAANDQNPEQDDEHNVSCSNLNGSYPSSIFGQPSSPFSEALYQMPFHRASIASVASTITPVSSMPNLNASFVFPTTPTQMGKPFGFGAIGLDPALCSSQVEYTLSPSLLSISPAYTPNLVSANHIPPHWPTVESTTTPLLPPPAPCDAGVASMPAASLLHFKSNTSSYRPRLCSTPMLPLPRLGLDEDSSPEHPEGSEHQHLADSPVNSMHCATPLSQQSISPETSPARMVFVHSPYEPILSLSLPSSPRKPFYHDDKKKESEKEKTQIEDPSDGAWADIDPEEEMDFATSINTFIKQPSKIVPVRRGSL